VMDPKKRRVVTATRFSSRSGAERKIFISTHDERPPCSSDTDAEDELHISEVDSVYCDTTTLPLNGAWSTLAFCESDHETSLSSTPGLRNVLPKDFKGLATPDMNPMSMALNHEEIVVGCADGTIYVMSMLGDNYRVDRPREVCQTPKSESSSTSAVHEY